MNLLTISTEAIVGIVTVSFIVGVALYMIYSKGKSDGRKK
jgi:hypothetical protein